MSNFRTDILDQARKMRPIIEKAVESLDDATASIGPTLFRGLNNDGSLIKAGTRINWKGVIKRAAVDIWDTEANTPDAAPTLWEDLLYRDGIRIIPSVITVTTTFSNGERGWWGDVLYESIVDNNVYTPEQYAANWKEVTE